MIDIFRNVNGAEKIICCVAGDNASIKKSIMSVDEVVVDVTVDSVLDIAIGDYIRIDDLVYELNRDPEFNQKSEVEHQYSFTFESPLYRLLDKLYINKATQKASFTLTGRLSDFVELLIWNINKTEGNPNGVDTGWTVGNIPVTDYKTLTFGNTLCRDVLTKLANDFSVEFFLSNKELNFVDHIENETELVFSQGRGKGLYTVSQKNVDTDNAVTRVYPIGGTQNVPAKYADADGHLILPEVYIENFTEYSKIVERGVEFDDISPSFVGAITSVAGENNSLLKCADIDFDIKEVAVGDEARINFLTGDLMGKTFSFQWNKDKKEITLNAQEDELALPDESGKKPMIPSALKKAKVQDEFNFTGLNLPEAYVANSIERLRKAATDWLDFYSRKRIKFELSIDHRYLRGKQMVYPGDLVTIKVPDHNIDKMIRVTSVDRKLKTGELTCVVSNYLDEKWEKKIEGQISSMQSIVGGSGSGLKIDIIEKHDIRPAKDTNVFSSLRVLEELLNNNEELKNLFLSKTGPDRTNFLLELLGGLEVKGGAKVDSLLVKSTLTRNQLKSRISDALMEEGDPDMLGHDLIEEGDGNPDVMSLALMEDTSDLGGGASTLGELDNVDPAFDTLKPGKYGIEVKADGVIRPVPATSLGVGSRLTLTAKSALSVIALSGDAVVLEYEFTSFDTSDGSATGAGTAFYNVNGVRVSTIPVEQGIVNWDCSKYLIAGDNTITVSVTDSYSVNRTLTFSVQVVSLSISSSFDAFQPYTGEIQFRYTPIGAIQKNVIFKLDNRVIATVPTTSNNRQMTQTIPAQAHGAHILEVYAEAVVGEKTVKSNILRYALACYISGNNTPIIASAFNETTAEQYNTLSIPFFVYNPVGSTASVALKVNGTAVSERVVDRTRQVWNYRADKAGSLTLNIAVGTVYKSFVLNIAASDIDVSAETEHLQLYLTAAGRSNSESNPGIWSNSGISASLTGFNFVTNGWVADSKGIVSLKVSGDARATIPLKIFGSDFRLTGKTIEFELSTTDVVDYNAVVVSCLQGGRGLEITAQSASLRSEQSYINTRFKEDERVRVAFVIEERTGTRLIYTYIDGIASGVIQYSTDDNFMQARPADIVIGSNDCTVCVHNIRVYESALNSFQMLDNCIADMDDMQTKIAMYTRNQVFDTYGDVSYPKVLEQIPGLTIIGDLPQFKGDKKTVVMVYVDRQDPARSWRAENVQIDVQGTSSQYYPRKNYKVKCKNGFIMTATGETVKKFAIREGEIPVNTFCFKADFAESSGTHNTGMAKIIERVLRAMNYLVPPQKLDARVRTTIDGYPFTIFHRATEGSALEFVGKYNFNNDKSTQETFGFVGAMECWEIKNNTSDRVLFKVSDYTAKDAEGKPDWLNDFEARYPDDDDLNAEYEAGKIPVNLKRLTDWLVSTKGNPTKFKAEASQYLDLNFILSYYSITELFAMVDQRAKNMFLTTYDGIHWAVIFYDNDTTLGINNEGAISFGYDVEYHDTEGSGQVWNGEPSVLWNNVEAAYLSEITAMYQTMRSSGAISYTMCIDVLNNEQSGKWCEAIYNADGKFKYIDPLLNEGNGSYLYALQGSRSQHRKWWLYNRFRYIDSKYVAGDFKNDYVTMRLYTPTVWQGVKPNADFTLTPAGDVYVAVKYGSYIITRRGHKGVPVVIKAPEIAFNDTETIVYGAAYIGSLGDISAMYPGTVDISKAVKLTELIAGSGAVGYQNNNLTVLAIGNNTLFRRLNVMNCPRLTQPIDVSGCENIEEIYAQGTSITSVKLPTAGRLSQLYLPGTITSLTIRNQSILTQDGFELLGISNLSTVYVENTNGIDSATLINRCLASSAPTLERVRLIGVDWRLNSLDTLVKLTKLKGLDVNGMNTDKSVITGKCHVLLATSVKLAEVKAAFPELTVTYTQLKPETVTTFVFGSSQGKAIKNSNLECNFDAVKVSETTYKITAQDNETITFTFKCDNHVDYSNTYLVAGTRTQNYSATYIPLRTIRVKVYNQSVYLQGATVAANGKRYTSDADGYVTLVRGGEAVSGTVEAFGYAGNTFSFSAITNDTTNTVEVYAAVEVKFVIKSSAGSSLLQGVTIQCGDEQGITNLYGECILMLGKGTLNYSITHTGYLTKTGTITVGTSASTVNVYLDPAKVDVKFVVKDKGNALLEGATVQCAGKSLTTDSKGECIITVDSRQTNEYSVVKYGYFDFTDNCTVTIYNMTVSVVMTFNAEVYKPVENGNIQMLINGMDVSITINATSARHAIDWGDGTPLHTTIITGNMKYSHTYQTKGDYQVEIKNCENIIACNADKGCLIAYWSIGNSKVVNLSFNNYSRLSYAGLVFKNDLVRTSFYQCFYSCSSLTGLPLGLFDNCVNVKSFEYCFNSCISISVIPPDLFDNCVNALNFKYCFYGCTSLTAIPEKLFSKCTEIDNFDGCFRKCSKIENIPSGLFDNCVNVKSFEYCFNRCLSLLNIPENLFSKCILANSFKSIFSECNNLTSIPEQLFANNSKATTFEYCFNSCISISVIPPDLFDNCVNALNFKYCFYGCTSLTAIPEKLFSKCTEIDNFDGCFRKCSKIENIPSGLFDNCHKATSFSGCFMSCPITTVPNGLFSNCTKTKIFWGVFWECGKLVSIPEGLFDSFTNVENFGYCFSGCYSLENIPLKLFKNCSSASSFEVCFSGCYKATHLPMLWVQYYGNDIVKTRCFKDCTNADNWSEVPVSWGGTAPEYVPPIQVSGIMMADYRALEMRIRNIELQQNMDKN